MDYVKAFVVGGIICVLAQILMDKTKLLPGRIMVILVCAWSSWNIQAASGICTVRSVGAAHRIWI